MSLPCFKPSAAPPHLHQDTVQLIALASGALQKRAVAAHLCHLSPFCLSPDSLNTSVYSPVLLRSLSSLPAEPLFFLSAAVGIFIQCWRLSVHAASSRSSPPWWSSSLPYLYPHGTLWHPSQPLPHHSLTLFRGLSCPQAHEFRLCFLSFVARCLMPG